jgi:DNA transposition AAA+ family ATPase
MAKDLRSLLQASGLTITDLAKEAGISKTTASLIVSGKYRGSSEKVELVMSVIQKHTKGNDQEKDEQAGVVLTNDQQLMLALLRAAGRFRKFAMLVGPSGVGKTFTCRKYEEEADVIVLQARPRWSYGGMLRSLCRVFGVSASGSNDEKLERILEKAQDKQVVVDEADLLVRGRTDAQILPMIEVYRQIYEAGASVVLVGLPVLWRAIVRAGETYVFSRIVLAREIGVPAITELVQFWRRIIEPTYPQLIDMGRQLAEKAKLHGNFRFLMELAQLTIELDGDVEGAMSFLFNPV